VSLCYQPQASRLTAVVLKARNIPRMDMTGLAGTLPSLIFSVTSSSCHQSLIIIIIIIYIYSRSLRQDLSCAQWTTSGQEEDARQEAHAESRF
jgi:hypothetical protein